MIRFQKGSVTVFLALIMGAFLSLCLVLIEGCRIYYYRVQAEQAIELAEFSVLSEFQQELFDQYGLFFLELDYEQGTERTDILEQRIQKYLIENAPELQTNGLKTGNIRRATDGGGAAFLEQAAESQKVDSGAKWIEELLGISAEVSLDEVDLGSILEKNENTAKGLMSWLQEEQKDEGKISSRISLPSISFPSVRALFEAVFGSEQMLSEKSVNLDERIQRRELEKGAGKEEKNGILSAQMFHSYIFQHCSYYGAEDTAIWNEALEYQIEYIISGQASDRGNLENIMWRIFLLRAGGNYLFYHQDMEKYAKAQAEATAVVGFLGNAALIELAAELFLISQAIEDGIANTRQIFAGEKVPLYENGTFAGVHFGYEEYLSLFLNALSMEKKAFRCMDILELEVRKKTGYEQFRMDHCTESFAVQWDYGMPSLRGGFYENTINRKFIYER